MEKWWGPAALAVLAALPVGAPASQSKSSVAPVYGAWGVDLSAIDPTVKPGDDFDVYANGAWNVRTTIPADKSIVSLRTRMGDTTENRLHGLLAAAERTGGNVPTDRTGKLGAFYAAFMNDGSIDVLGDRPIRPELNAIAAAHDRTELARLMGRGKSDFYGTIFDLDLDVDLKNAARYAVHVSQAGLGLPDREYYSQPQLAPQLAAYQTYLTRLLTLVKWPYATSMAPRVVAFEAQIAGASWTKVEQRDVHAKYNPLATAGLNDFAPGFDWSAFLTEAGLISQPRVIVAEKSALPRIAAIFAITPLPVLKAWQAAKVVDNAAFYMSKPYADARFTFRDQVLAGQTEQQPRWRRALTAVGGGDCGATEEQIDCFGHMDFGLGQLYTDRFFPAADKTRIQRLVGDVKAAMRARLERLDWMSPATKLEALRKLDTYQIKVGYPDRPRNYSGLRITRDDLVGDVRRTAAWNWRFHTSRLNDPVDRSDWTMTPQTNDAYNGSLQDIVFPAAILQAPMFDPAADPAVNYGAIGAVIGHELTHGFDDQGRKLDADGQLRDWWTAADAAAFEERAKRLGAQFSKFEPLTGVHVNGALTMGENIADLGGLTIALEAYHRSLDGKAAQTLDGYSGDQRVFLGWAQAWRGHATQDFVRKQVATDPHAPRAFRIIGPARNIDAWYRSFHVGAGERYYLKPGDRVAIW
ncbi:M13 family metallopeptidase [Sphingomonas sp. PAMC26645]|uniref:M13 family metallopeptidase n=1 Tax=Sphingomonas sp. PAMC26645 TaxID=2565555 RepID=UPI001FFA09F7|nr:M13 family metallopeptidase [Sphingomonas sp. PAMC26645]